MKREIKVSIVAAIAKKDRAIGYKNKLLWDIPADLQHFKKITQGHPVIMGQKTYESIGRPLPGRLNIILSRDNNLKVKGCTVAHSVEETINVANVEEIRASRSARSKEIFFIGGGQIYTQALPYADRLYLTLVDGEYQADTYFPDYSEFKKIISREKSSDNGYNFEYIVMEKPKNQIQL